MAVSGPGAGGRARRGPGCAAWGGTILATVVVLCCVGAFGGAGVEWFTTRPGDAALPPAPDQLPAAAYLPEVTVDGVTAALTDQGYDCDPESDAPGDPSLRVTDAEFRLGCNGPELSGLSSGGVVAEHDRDAGFRGVTVVCRYLDENPSHCGELYAGAIDAVLADHPAEVREAALSWVGENLEAVAATTTESGLELTVRRFNDNASELRIWPA